MSRLLYALVVSLIALTPPVRAQVSTAPEKKNISEPAVVSVEPAAQLNKAVEDCACESQVLPEALAIVNGVRISRQDLEKATKERVNELQRQVVEARKGELYLQVNSKLLVIEAKKRGISTTELLEKEVVAKTKEPTEAEAQLFYDQNKTRIQADFNSARQNIVRYLKEQQQRDEAGKLAQRLREASNTKMLFQEALPPRDAADRARLLAVVNGERITSGDIEDSLRPLIFDLQDRVYKLRRNELDLSINDMLLVQEAQKRKITTNALLAAELKPKPVTEADASAFYDQNKDRVSGDFAQTKESIISYLQEIEVRKAEQAFVDKLRAAASIQTFLVAPQGP